MHKMSGKIRKNRGRTDRNRESQVTQFTVGRLRICLNIFIQNFYTFHFFKSGKQALLFANKYKIFFKSLRYESL